ncbi:hypothetical protein PAHAL_4G121100 [Panicum hallii]|uniref:F-box domain-containing protein n=1 Tax=Panicum hallii TaxID=206008 RepID=A0A2S3HIU3_9POAL|nr:hypothetical protein PAHAL_4G121100 [Panicum hallii]
MEDLPEALLREIIKRLPTTSDLNSLSLVSKRLYTVEAELRDAIYVGCGVCPVTVALASLCSRFRNLCKVEFNYSGWTPNDGMQLGNQGLHVFSSCCPSLTDLTLSFCSYIDDSGLGFLACFKKLMSLRLKALPQIASAGLLSVAVGCKSLSAFRLMSCENVSSVEWLEYLGKSGSLGELVVGNCERISQFDLLRFGSGFMKVQMFEFQNSNLLKDLTLAWISTEAEIGLCCLLRKCKALENLSLYYVLVMLAPQYCEGYDCRTTLTDDSLKALALWCPMLQSVELTFFGCEPDWPDEIGFTQEGLVMLIRSCPIRDLKLGGANIFDDEGMKALSRARFLESLKLINCVAITDAGMHFLACSPSLIDLTLELCDESLTIAECCQISLKAVQGAAKTVHYTDECPGYKEWMDRCVCEPQV